MALHRHDHHFDLRTGTAFYPIGNLVWFCEAAFSLLWLDVADRAVLFGKRGIG